MFIFFSKRNEPKKILLSPNPFLHIKGLKQKIAETADFFYVLVSRDDAIIFFIFIILYLKTLRGARGGKGAEAPDEPGRAGASFASVGII